MHVGDDVIVSVAECMAKALPPQALSARISGDRLAALIPNTRHGRGRRARGAHPRRGRGHRAARRPGLVRSVGLPRRRAGRALRQRAGACAGDRGDRLQGRQGPRPQPRRGVPGLRSEHHPAPYRHPGDRQAARRARQRQFPPRCAAHPAAARQLRTAALRVADPHAGRPRRDDPARQIPLLGRALPAHADGRSLGRAPRLRAARRAQRGGGRGYRALRDQSVRPVAAGRDASSRTWSRRSRRASCRRTCCASS